jgi:hypothetical protein
VYVIHEPNGTLRLNSDSLEPAIKLLLFVVISRQCWVQLSGADIVLGQLGKDSV